MQNLSIQEILSKKDNYNLAIPFMEVQQINPFYKICTSSLYVNTSERASQIFKVGSWYLGNNQWENLYSLQKPFLDLLATAAGIQFGSGSGDVVKIDENTWKASAFGAIRLPDGGIRTSHNFKVIDLVTEEKKYRMSYEEKAKKGIEDYKAASSAAEKYAGEWVDTGKKNEKGYTVKLYSIAEQDRETYIEHSVLDAMTQLRSSAPQKAATGAILRVVKELLGIKGTYTMDELKKPFAVARMSFSPDYNDPLIRQMLLQQAMQSVGNLFGNTQPTMQQAVSIPQVNNKSSENAIVMDGTLKETIDQKNSIRTQQMQSLQQEIEQEIKEEDRSQDFCCDKCGNHIGERIWDYFVEHFGRPLCYQCQKIIRNSQGGSR